MLPSWYMIGFAVWLWLWLAAWAALRSALLRGPRTRGRESTPEANTNKVLVKELSAKISSASSWLQYP